ncbi:MAG: energy transducer TonB [Candidatus Sulfotelmatobacter sp.]|jgi:TonB family protein
MRVRFAISIFLTCFLTCSSLLSARVQQAQSPQQNPQQKPTELTKVCREKVPPPCATPPRPTYAPQPEYSAEARSARYQGTCVLLVIVEADGSTSHIRVRSRLGMGLDEKAIEAVKRWKFAPALKDGKPVPVEIAIQVDFYL